MASSQYRSDLIPTVVLCMLTYTRSSKSNIYQRVKRYFIFVYNIIKRYIDVLHFMGLCVSYKTFLVDIKENTKEVELKI